ncbi:hypothetical protein A4A49_61101 [Nicotiana attenuata]|uniref:Uncharacterized protein n=1 Tax=Nicotiana attenuata TaxID=49451 RepID=A0A314KJM8_NICAT|nr:hypothetical protein A4A49_61101 [Nicotiana attenuata]
MLGKFSEQVEINVPAIEVWNLYSTLQFAKFVVEKLPHIAEKVELVEGNGDPGSVLLVRFSFYLIKWEVMEKSENSSIIKLTLDFETKDAENIHLSIANLQTFVAIMKASADYLEQKNK